MMLTRSKKADFFTFWVEGFFIILLILGFIIAAAIQSGLLSYIIAFLSGLLFGKLIYHNKKDAFTHYFLLTIGFIIGYTIGNAVGNRYFTIIFFALGVIASYYGHDKGLF